MPSAAVFQLENIEMLPLGETSAVVRLGDRIVVHHGKILNWGFTVLKAGSLAQAELEKIAQQGDPIHIKTQSPESYIEGLILEVRMRGEPWVYIIEGNVGYINLGE